MTNEKILRKDLGRNATILSSSSWHGLIFAHNSCSQQFSATPRPPHRPCAKAAVVRSTSGRSPISTETIGQM